MQTQQNVLETFYQSIWPKRFVHRLQIILKRFDKKDVNETQYVRHFLEKIGLSVVKKRVRVSEFDGLPANHATMICSCATVSGTVKYRRTLSFLVHGGKAYSAFLQYYAQATQEYVYWVCGTTAVRVTHVWSLVEKK